MSHQLSNSNQCLQKSVIPVHYSLWMAEVGCAKVASANVETVFSGAGRISMKSHCLGPQILSDYAFLHYNYKYDWLRPVRAHSGFWQDDTIYPLRGWRSAVKSPVEPRRKPRFPFKGLHKFK